MWRIHEDYERTTGMNNVITTSKDQLLNMKRSILLVSPVLCETLVFWKHLNSISLQSFKSLLEVHYVTTATNKLKRLHF